MNNNPIGIFDSGIGGLTVLEKIYELLPNEDYIYLADHLNCPYGTKSEDEIRKIVINNAKYLEGKGAKCIVIACNTASLFISDIRDNVKIPVIGVIENACKKACETTKNKKIGVIGTNMTIEKAKYQSLINDNNMMAFGVPCSEFVDYIENNLNNFELGRKIVKEKLDSLKNKDIDTLIYGCTHFSIIENFIKEVLGNLNYIDCGTTTAIYLKKYLLKEKMYSDKKCGSIKIFTTGKLENVLKHIKLFKISYNSIEEIIIK